MIPELEKFGAYLVLWLDPVSCRLTSATIEPIPNPAPETGTGLIPVIYLQDFGETFDVARRKIVTILRSKHSWCRSLLHENQIVRTKLGWNDPYCVLISPEEVELATRQFTRMLFDALSELLLKRAKTEIAPKDILDNLWDRTSLEQWIVEQSSELVEDAEKMVHRRDKPVR